MGSIRRLRLVFMTVLATAALSAGGMAQRTDRVPDGGGRPKTKDPLRKTLDEYDAFQAELAHLVDPAPALRNWDDRLSQSVSRSPDSPWIRLAKIRRLGIANVLGNEPIAASLADELSVESTSVENRVFFAFEGGEILMNRFRKSHDRVDAAAALAKLTAARQLFLESRAKDGGGGDVNVGRYVISSYLEGELLGNVFRRHEASSEVLEAAGAYLRTEASQAARRHLATTQYDDELFLSSAMLASARARKVDHARELYGKLASISSLRVSVERHFLALNEAVYPSGGPAFQNELQSWLDTHRESAVRHELLYALGLDQARCAMPAEAARTFELLVAECEPRVESDGRILGVVREEEFQLVALRGLLDDNTGRERSRKRFLRLAEPNDPRAIRLRSEPGS
ncbi:MAG: hypothetical protein IH987_16545 [Planctomycetes bacterium]|nr:hypothetical protein [Planctomycetota bacterium]